jgi:DNA-damage-inducible protein I
MRIELMVNQNNVPENVFYQVESEFTRRMAISWPDALVRVRLGGANELSVLGGLKEDKQHVDVESELEAMFDEADDWLEQPNYDM